MWAGRSGTALHDREPKNVQMAPSGTLVLKCFEVFCDALGISSHLAAFGLSVSILFKWFNEFIYYER